MFSHLEAGQEVSSEEDSSVFKMTNHWANAIVNSENMHNIRSENLLSDFCKCNG
jgi:hypothetical protein